jgi:hypothetical protein
MVATTCAYAAGHNTIKPTNVAVATAQSIADMTKIVL